MRGRYDQRVSRDGKGDAFHHFLDHLDEVAHVDDEVDKASVVVKNCWNVECVECRGFISVFDGEHCSNHFGQSSLFLQERGEEAVPRIHGVHE